MHNILLGLYTNPPMKAVPCLPFSWIWNVVNYFVWLKVNVPMSGQVIFINISFLWRLGRFWCWFILVIICLMSLLTPIKMKTSPILFFFHDLGFLAKLQITLHCIFRIYPCTWYWISKSLWDNMCLIGVQCMLWMPIYIIYALVRMTTTPKKKIYDHHFLFLTPKYIL